MCIILDADSFSKFRAPDNEDMKPVWRWLEKNGKIVRSDTEKFEEEWEKGGMSSLEDELMRAGKIKLISKGVQEKANELEGGIASNDEHIIALAIVAEVKILVSGGDKKLISDFKNADLVGGKVYLRKQHAHLLKKDTCP